MTNVVTFGRHKGRPIGELLFDDPGYVLWLLGQYWFREKYAALRQDILDRGADVLFDCCQRAGNQRASNGSTST
jgi:hypothetical protein